MIRTRLSLFGPLLVGVLALAAGYSAQAQSFTFTYTAFDPPPLPGGYPASGGNSIAYSNSNTGVIVGVLADGDGISGHGYTYQNGVYNTVDYPGATAGTGTYLRTINSAGVLSGQYFDTLGNETDFIDQNGTFSSPTHANAPGGTFFNRLNDAGQLASFYKDASNITHSAIYNIPTNTFTDLPDEGIYGTYVQQIATNGDALVNYLDAQGNEHGSLLDNGVYTPLDFPGAVDTRTNSINDSGFITGRYSDGTTFHGLAYVDNNWYSLDYPGAIETDLYGINNADQIVGDYVDPSGTIHSLAIQATETPEPGSVAMLAAGGVTGAGFLVRRKRLRKTKRI